jgi:hypothetical protein
LSTPPEGQQGAKAEALLQTKSCSHQSDSLGSHRRRFFSFRGNHHYLWDKTQLSSSRGDKKTLYTNAKTGEGIYDKT